MPIAILSVILIVFLFFAFSFIDKARARSTHEKEWQEDLAYKMDNAKPNELFWCLPGNNPKNPIQEEGIWVGYYNDFFPERLFKTIRQKGTLRFNRYELTYNANEKCTYINDLPIADKWLLYIKKHKYILVTESLKT